MPFCSSNRMKKPRSLFHFPAKAAVVGGEADTVDSAVELFVHDDRSGMKMSARSGKIDLSINDSNLI